MKCHRMLQNVMKTWNAIECHKNVVKYHRMLLNIMENVMESFRMSEKDMECFRMSYNVIESQEM